MRELFNTELIELAAQSATIEQLNVVIKARDMRIAELEAKLTKVRAEREELKSSLSKRDLEQQAKGVAMALELESWSVMNTYAIPVEDLYQLEKDLRKYANEFNKHVDTNLNKG
jgi:uncharacterized coiled-coil protein SlyX